MHPRSLSFGPRFSCIIPYKSQTLPRTCRTNLPSSPRITRANMLALSMGLMSKLGLKGKPAMAANGNDLSAPSSSDATDQALQGILFSKQAHYSEYKCIYLTFSNILILFLCSIYQRLASLSFLWHLRH
jgi:hypothetical protein